MLDRVQWPEMKLTQKQREILTQLAENKDTAECELVCVPRGGWWLSDNRVDGRVAYFLHRNVLISEDSYTIEA
jgi:hypothetical protein